MAEPRQLRLWAQGDAHVGRDLGMGRKSLSDALEQSESGGEDGGPPFEWDFAVNVGDYCGFRDLPSDEEGEEIIKQFSVLKNHKREQIYSISGNHDRNAPYQPDGYWFQKWIDPMGENTEFSRVDAAQYPYPVDGTWERYKFQAGNILFLMMSDVNEKSQPKGRGELEGNPGGVVTQETFEWWKDQVAANKDKIIITAHHYVLKETTFASGLWEGMRKDRDGNWEQDYHRYIEEGSPSGASFLCWVGGKYDEGLFESFLEEHPNAVDMWFGGHTHSNPDDHKGGRGCFERKYGNTMFMNICALTRYMVPEHAIPHSWLLTFTEGSDEVRAQCYMHTSEYKPQGWYEEAERTIKLSTAFSFEG
jgi:hypothetical protein